MRHKRTGWWCCVVWTAALLCRVRAQTSLVLGYSSELEDERFDEKNVESRTGFELAVAMAQDAGSVPGYTLTTAYCNAKRSDLQSLECASGLVAAHGADLVGVVGHRFSAGLRGGSLFYNLHGVPLVSPTSTGSEHISKEGIENVFRVRTSAAAEMEALVMTLAELGVNKVGALVTVSPKDSLPSQYMEQFMYFADLAGIQMMSVSTLNINSWLTDFSLNGWLSNSIKTQTADALRSLDNAGCNAFLILAVSDDLASVVSLGHELGLTGTDKLWVGRELHTFFNDAAIPFPRAAVISAVQRFEAEASAVAAFENGWRERTSNLTEFTLTGPDLYDMGGDGSANSYAYLAYDATWSIIYALQAVANAGGDPRNGTAVMERMRQTDFEGSTGRVRFSDPQQERVAPFDVLNPFGLSGLGDSERRIAAYYSGGGLDFSKFPGNGIMFGDGTATFDDGSALSARSTGASGEGLTLSILNTPALVFLQLRDNFGAALAGGDYSTLQIIGAGVSDLTLVATSNSTLTVTYYSRNKSREQLVLAITVRGVHIQGSPYTVTVATRCGAGQAFSTGDDGGDRCEDCPAGMYTANAGSLECLSCPAGSFAPRTGATNCLSCDTIMGAAFYQNSEGADACKRCPLNMERSRGLPGLDIAECDCIENSYRQGDSTAAAELGCLYCPDGAVCPGAGVLPYPLPGYYSDPVLARESGWFVSCGSNSAMCVGGEGFACSNNTRGDRCAQCAEDHFRIGGLCYECPGGITSWLLSLGGTSCVVVFFLTLNALTAGAFDSIDIALLYLQVLSTIQGYSTWSNAVLDKLAQYVSIINFDLDFVTPACVFGVWEYEAHFTMVMVQLPAAIGLCVLTRMWVSLRCRRNQQGRIATQAEMETLHDFTDLLIARLFSFAVVVYNNLVIVSFQPFACEAVPGKEVMRAAPHIECGTGVHHVLVAVGGLGVVFYVVGIPLFFLLTLKYARWHDLMKNHRYLQRLGFLYRRYNRDTYWWELALLLRRLSVSVVLVFLGEYPGYQGTLAVLILLACFGMETKAEPFKFRNTFLLDAMAIGCLIVYLVCNMVGGEENSVQQWVMMSTMLITVSMVMLVALLFASQEVYSMRVSNRVEVLLRKALMSITGQVGADGAVVEEALLDTEISRRQQMRLQLIDDRITNGEQSCLLSELNDEMSEHVLAQGGSSASADGMHPLGPVLSLLAERNQLEYKSAWLDDPIVELKSLRAAIGDIQADPLFTLRRSNAVGELATTLDSQSLLDWVDKVGATGAETYAQLALLLNDALSDSSVVSVFGFNASAHFCQHLGKSNPFIFDWLLDRSTGEQRAAFRGIMRGMTETYAEFGHQGVYAQLVDETDIGPLLLWLTLASDHQFELLKSFFEGIVAATAIDHRDAARERTAKTFSASRMFKGTKLVVKPTVKHVLDRPKQTMHNLMDIVAGEVELGMDHAINAVMEAEHKAVQAGVFAGAHAANVTADAASTLASKTKEGLADAVSKTKEGIVDATHGLADQVRAGGNAVINSVTASMPAAPFRSSVHSHFFEEEPTGSATADVVTAGVSDGFGGGALGPLLNAARTRRSGEATGTLVPSLGIGERSAGYGADEG